MPVKRILGLTIAFMLLIGIGTWAYFSDTETSTGNQFAAGTLDLKNTDLTGQSGINASPSKDFEIAVTLKDTTGSDSQADGITVTMNFALNQ